MVVLFKLRTERNECRVGLFEFADNFLQSIQLHIAVGSPVSAEHCEYDGTLGEQVRRLYDLTRLIFEFERG